MTLSQKVLLALVPFAFAVIGVGVWYLLSGPHRTTSTTPPATPSRKWWPWKKMGMAGGVIAAPLILGAILVAWWYGWLSLASFEKALPHTAEGAVDTNRLKEWGLQFWYVLAVIPIVVMLYRAGNRARPWIILVCLLFGPFFFFLGTYLHDNGVSTPNIMLQLALYSVAFALALDFLFIEGLSWRLAKTAIAWSLLTGILYAAVVQLSGESLHSSLNKFWGSSCAIDPKTGLSPCVVDVNGVLHTGIDLTKCPKEGCVVGGNGPDANVKILRQATAEDVSSAAMIAEAKEKLAHRADPREVRTLDQCDSISRAHPQYKLVTYSGYASNVVCATERGNVHAEMDPGIEWTIHFWSDLGGEAEFTLPAYTDYCIRPVQGKLVVWFQPNGATKQKRPNQIVCGPCPKPTDEVVASFFGNRVYRRQYLQNSGETRVITFTFT